MRALMPLVLVLTLARIPDVIAVSGGRAFHREGKAQLGGRLAHVRVPQLALLELRILLLQALDELGGVGLIGLPEERHGGR